MPDPTSYSWAAILQNAVPIGEAAVIQTPGFIDPANYDVPNAQVVYGGEVLGSDEFSATWTSDWSSVSIVNNSDEEWPPQDFLAIAVAGIPFDANQIEASFTALAARVQKLETEQEVHDDQLTALEASVSEMQQTLYDPQVGEQDTNISIGQVVVGTPILQMYAVHSPTAWAITYEKKNGNATGGFWTIDNDGWISATNGAVASVKVNDVIEVGVRATNVFGSGDGIWASTVWP